MTNYLKYAKGVINIEKDAVSELIKNLDNDFSNACETLMKTAGRIVIGMGKSGHIGHRCSHLG